MALICSHAFLIEIAPHTPDLCHPPLTAVCFSFNFISSFNFFFFFLRTAETLLVKWTAVQGDICSLFSTILV